MPDDEESEFPLVSTKKQIPRPPECWRTRNDKLKLRPRKVSPFWRSGEDRREMGCIRTRPRAANSKKTQGQPE